MVTVYGIPNCDSVKKATSWLTKHKVEFSFHNYKQQGISKAKLKQWSKKFGWEKLLNKKSTTWRNLTPGEQQNLTTESAAIALMVQQPTVIKRPVIEDGKILLAGFDENEYTVMLDPKG